MQALPLCANCEAKNLFQVLRERFNKARAIRMVSKTFGVTLADVERAAYYWN